MEKKTISEILENVKMSKEDILYQLRDLESDRYDFIIEGEETEDNVFVQDLKAINVARQIVEKFYDEFVKEFKI